jgi:hypothetical protein
MVKRACGEIDNGIERVHKKKGLYRILYQNKKEKISQNIEEKNL